jgi:hypothetical protein
MSGFVPSAEIRKAGLADASVGLHIISNGVDGRETRPVYASCKLHNNDATVNEPPEPTAIILDSLAARIADASFVTSDDKAVSYV